VDNSIQIEVLALLDPKSGGVIHEKEFAKALTKDLKALIKNTEKTLKQLSVNPALAVHPKYKGIKDKRKFLSAMKSDGKAFKKEAENAFKKLDINAKMSVALDVDRARKDFARQLDTLERSYLKN